MKYTIKDLSEDKCIVKNDGTLEELRKVLKLAFPNDKDIPSGVVSLYRMAQYNSEEWVNADRGADKPIQSVKDFLISIDIFQNGELIMVSDNGVGWVERIYIGKHSCGGFICESGNAAVNWKYAKKINTIKLTKQEIADKFNISIEELEII